METWIGAKRLGFEQLDSTNEYLKREWKTLPDGALIWAKTQTGGKGRLGRQWQSDPQGLWFSFLLKPDFTPERAMGFSTVVALAIKNCVEDLSQMPGGIKWPNDILIGRKKVCGILVEMKAGFEKIEYLIAGIGINLNNRQFSGELAEKATSLMLESGKPVPHESALESAERWLTRYYNEWLQGKDFSKEYAKSCVTIGRAVQVLKNNQATAAFAQSIDDNGRLVVSYQDGSQEALLSGEVSIRGDGWY